jgi:hypothetical protein
LKDKFIEELGTDVAKLNAEVIDKFLDDNNVPRPFDNDRLRDILKKNKEVEDRVSEFEKNDVIGFLSSVGIYSVFIGLLKLGPTGILTDLGSFICNGLSKLVISSSFDLGFVIPIGRFTLLFEFIITLSCLIPSLLPTPV